MATPFTKRYPNGTIQQFGEYYGSDSKNFTAFKSWQLTHKTPWMTNRNGGWRMGSVAVTRADPTGYKVFLDEYYAYSQITGLPTGASMTVDWVPDGYLPPAENVINCVRNKVKNGSINIPVFAAEAAKSLGMVDNAVKRLANSATAIASGRWGKAAKILGIPTPKVPAPHKRGKEGLASNWLAYRYGWIPLLSDVDGAVDALTRPAMSGVMGFARCKRPYMIEKSYTATGFKSVVRVTGFVSAGVYYELKNSTDFTSLGLTNPYEVVWELVPYSFVVDWFIPIGKALSALDAFDNVTVLASFVNKRYRSEVTNYYNKLSPDGYYRYAGQAQCSKNGMIRTVDNYGGSVVTTQIPRVGFNMDLLLPRVLDGIALLSGIFKR